MENEFTHFNSDGKAKMVDVTDKEITFRTASAEAVVYLNETAYKLLKSGGYKKGDVLAVAQVAGIMGLKNTAFIIPMCHNIPLTNADIIYELDDEKCSIRIICTVKCRAKTGAEMEALTGAGICALTIYDMCKSVQRDIMIGQIQLLEKTGGKSGHYKKD